MSKGAISVVVIVLVAYFVFTSGFIYEVTKCDATDRFEVPYSLGMSAERTGLAGIYGDDDMDCLYWMILNWDGSEVVGDYNTKRLIGSYIPVYQGRNVSAEFNAIPDNCYIYVSTWNINHQKWVYGSGIGLRTLYELPDLSEYKVLYQSGKSKVLWSSTSE